MRIARYLLAAGLLNIGKQIQNIIQGGQLFYRTAIEPKVGITNLKTSQYQLQGSTVATSGTLLNMASNYRRLE